MKYSWAGLVLAICLFITFQAFAHANLAQSQPAVNENLATSPSEIRLWFTEPLEPSFSTIYLWDSTGKTIETPASQVDAADPLQMSLALSTALPEGLYTVVWAVTSAADGHSTQGSFPFSIGEGHKITQTVTTSQNFPLGGMAVRWLNFLSLALLLGGNAFWLWIWLPIQYEDTYIEKTLQNLLWGSWFLVGIAGIFLLVYQTDSMGRLALKPLSQVMTETRFGSLWQLRMGLWSGLGLWWATTRFLKYEVGFTVSLGLILTTSLFSHANAAHERWVAVANDWIHLMAMGLWLGGLFYLLAVAWMMQAQIATLTRVVGYFSNLARLCVLTLALTGFYAAWLHVSSVEALLETRYGQALLLKLLLFLPLLVVASINLFYTRHQLEQRQVWLRRLVWVEIMLASGMLLAVGVMTASNPAHSQSDQSVNPAPSQMLALMEMGRETHLHLEVIPGWVGENTFKLTLYEGDEMTEDTILTDASLIRLRFENLDEDIGRSELRPTLGTDGRYTISGNNISLGGIWQIRATVQRPQKFDEVVDFEYFFTLPPVLPVHANHPQSPYRTSVLLLVGLGSLCSGGFFLGRRQSLGEGWIALTLMLMGAWFLMAILMH